MPDLHLLNSHPQALETAFIATADRSSSSLLSLDLARINQRFDSANAAEIVAWSAATFGEGLVMSTSFGIQAAVMLHLVTAIIPDIPIIWIDTGYLPPETYQFAEELSQRLQLTRKVYQSPLSPDRMEAIHGKLWSNNDLDSLNLYDKIRKVEPMQRALKELKATAWLAGLRRDQTDHRKTLQWVNQQGERYKILPILDWNAKTIYQYLTKYDLPY
ncbi:phosphoadenylyl-sulfate reductase, partial [Microcystis sp.]|uniref:phosphoadenylyl-sulfate reductase n=1 Tax=Microcystis sp. TaxID=1127 RepID=UPI00391F0D2C